MKRQGNKRTGLLMVSENLHPQPRVTPEELRVLVLRHSVPQAPPNFRDIAYPAINRIQRNSKKIYCRIYYKLIQYIKYSPICIHKEFLRKCVKDGYIHLTSINLTKYVRFNKISTYIQETNFLIRYISRSIELLCILDKAFN